jgi:hypothetical protein
MKYFFVFLFLIPLSIRAQNLYPAIGISSDNISLTVYNATSPSEPLVSRVNRLKLDNSCLFDVKVKKSFYLKSGFYLNVRKYEFYHYFRDCYGGYCHWEKSYADPVHRVPVFIIPLLFSWKPFDNNKFSETHIDVGPYMGFNFLMGDNSDYLKSKDYGSEIAIGLGGRKISINLYYIQSFINMAKRDNYKDVEKIKGKNFGVNLAWKFCLSKKKCLDKKESKQ